MACRGSPSCTRSMPRIKLAGTASNRDGLGATVKVHSGSKTYTRYHDGKSGHLAQSSMPFYFGLGEAEKIDSLEVLWPSGSQQIIKALPTNRLLKVTETTGKERP